MNIQPNFVIHSLTVGILINFVSLAYADEGGKLPVELEPLTAHIKVRDSLNEGYTVVGSYTPTGMPMTLREIPQSISVITSEQMQDQHITTMDRALAQATGVSQRIWGSKRSGYNHLFARGSQIRNLQIDGLPINEAERDLGNTATSAFERVEVVRGVSGLLDGSGEPSATVNLVRKRPSKEPVTEISASIGSNQRIGLGVDSSQSLNQSGTWRGRAVVSAEKGDSWRQREKDQALSVYAINEYKLNDTNLHAGIHWQQGKEFASASHTFSAYDMEGYATHFDVKDNPAPNWAYSKSRSLNAFAGLTHRFNADWQGKLEYNYTQSEWNHPYGVASVLSVNHSDNGSDMITGFWYAKPTTHTLSASVRGFYPMFGRQHDLIVGLNGYHNSNTDARGGRNMGRIGDIYEFSKTGDYPYSDNYRINLPQPSKAKQFGAYLATRVFLSDEVSLIAGGRFGKRSQSSYDRSVGGLIDYQNSKFTPYAGLTWDFLPNWSAYTSYSSLFVPQSQKDSNGVRLEPMTGDNVEVGVKGELADGKLNISAGVYRTKKDKMAVVAGRDDTGDPYYRATDHAKTHGFDIDVGGRLRPNWQVQAGYSQSLTKDALGNRLQTETIPHRMVKLFSGYDVNDKLTVGGGVRWQSQTYSTSVIGSITNSDDAKQRALANSRQNSYALADLMVRYRLNEQADISLNVDNVFDKKYRTQPDRMSFGSPRAVTLSARYRF